MSKCRFLQIKRYLHFNNNDDLPANRGDKLYKIRPVYDLLSERWRSMYDLGEFLTIDEGMLMWRGGLSFKVYNKNKPIKYGIKSHILADSQSKYCWNIDVHHDASKSLTEIVTALLTAQNMSHWHTLYMDMDMDNFYNGVSMSEYLLDRQVHTVGKLRSHHGAPREIREAGNDKDNGNALFMHLQWGNGFFSQVKWELVTSLHATTARSSFWPGRTSDWWKLFPPSMMPPQPQFPGGKSVVEGLWKTSTSPLALLITTSICQGWICWTKWFHASPSPENRWNGPKRSSSTLRRSVFTTPLCCTRQKAARRSTITCTNSCCNSSGSWLTRRQFQRRPMTLTTWHRPHQNNPGWTLQIGCAVVSNDIR